MKLTLPDDVSASRLARRWTERQLAPLGLAPARLGIIELLVTELVTNAVEHTSSAPVLTLDADDGVLRVEVEDDGGGLAQIPDRDPERLGGWGLRIVDELADSWGASYRASGAKVLWFCVSMSA
jgi:anti-sigma regulatory factor (Ser/Thr protein kinase)